MIIWRKKCLQKLSKLLMILQNLLNCNKWRKKRVLANSNLILQLLQRKKITNYPNLSKTQLDDA
jgi:hypothetical protein